jgi:hypothetical protein
MHFDDDFGSVLCRCHRLALALWRWRRQRWLPEVSQVWLTIGQSYEVFSNFEEIMRRSATFGSAKSDNRG